MSKEQLKLNEPWLDENGQPLPMDKLRTLSKEWSYETWENYLSSIETPRKEALLRNPRLVEELSEEEYKKTLPSSMPTETISHLRTALEKILPCLPKKQRQVLECIFWENLSLSETAKKFGVTKGAIQNTKRRAFVNIMGLMLEISSNQHEVS